MKCRVITIGHDYGSGGRNIGRMLSEKLDYHYYDTKITTEIAKESGLSPEYIKNNGEYASHKNLFLFTLNNWTNGGPTLMDEVFFMQREFIINIANKENCIIVGHCSDHVLAEVEGSFHVYIKSDIKERAKRVTENYKEKLDDPIKELTERDAKEKLTIVIIRIVS